MLGLVKTALTALSAYLQLRNKAFYYNITQESRNKQQDIINEIMKQETSENIGVRNVKERLELFFHEEGLFEIRNDKGVEVVIKLPIEVTDV